MPHKYAQIAFTESVRQVQQEHNSRSAYAGMDHGEDYNYLLTQNEVEFIQARDSFYMASVSESNWPYVQHRGGPTGFMRVLDESTIGFADFSGNRQYVSTGNFRSSDRVSLFFMDYANRRRLKMMGRIEQVADTDREMLARLEVDGYRANVERSFLIHVEAFDWNCPQHITPRYSEDEVEQLLAPLREENKALKAQHSSSGNPGSNLDRPQGKGTLPLVVTGIRQLTPRIRAYELRHRNGDSLPKFKAGAHLQLPVTLENGDQVLRHYSICSNPKRRDIYEVAVLKEPGGQGGSLSIHQNLQLGQTIDCDRPENYFPLHDDTRPAVLFAGGIGITPIKAMAQELSCRGSTFDIHYAGRSLKEMAFQDRLGREFPDNLTLYSTGQKQRIDIENIMRQAEQDTVFYVCGPVTLIDGVIQAGEKLGIDNHRIRFERFKAASLQDARALTLKLARTNKEIYIDKGQSLLDAMLNEGIEMPFSCTTGACKTCVVKVLDGDPQHFDNCLTQEERETQQLICPCVSRSYGDYLTLDI